ncbi:uncharacterized protein LOC118326255 isoform X2 [Morone saxatilis]|uniref:uncharacterized protein LOC118326255 isoform X2 n=1 Tax=Morone saxatilis TaxID=34816 RepID=UPI0015E1CF8D|nr:uncharacterized protein LOC118326255 isoform X2 [Morone saxatilis]
MQFYGVLVLLVTLSTACGLKCYIGGGADNKLYEPKTCYNGERCTTVVSNGATVKDCMLSSSCHGPIKCCEEDLCNSAIPTGSSVFLLLVSSAIITLFL